MTRIETNIRIHSCDYTAPSQRLAIPALINAYIVDEMGGGRPLSVQEQARLIRGLSERPAAIVLLAEANDAYAGLLVAFENFSTFTARPMINIHDLIVLHEYRRLGIGRLLMNRIMAEAARRKASRLTLEVRTDNPAAQNLYQSLGFEAPSPEMYYWRKYLE
jgi:ribosomal protein S18 acetylase RimI-like enzyme